MRAVLTGCSGGGKTTVLNALSVRGHGVVPEPGRRIVEAARAGQGGALPWEDEAAFCAQALEIAVRDFREAEGDLVVFDRTFFEAVLGYARLGLELPVPYRDVIAELRFDHVFLFPPWPGIAAEDPDRAMGEPFALREYAELEQALREWRYRPVLVPKVSVAARVAFVEQVLAGT